MAASRLRDSQFDNRVTSYPLYVVIWSRFEPVARIQSFPLNAFG